MLKESYNHGYLIVRLFKIQDNFASGSEHLGYRMWLNYEYMKWGFPDFLEWFYITKHGNSTLTVKLKNVSRSSRFLRKHLKYRLKRNFIYDFFLQIGFVT